MLTGVPSYLAAGRRYHISVEYERESVGQRDRQYLTNKSRCKTSVETGQTGY